VAHEPKVGVGAVAEPVDLAPLVPLPPDVDPQAAHDVANDRQRKEHLAQLQRVAPACGDAQESGVTCLKGMF